MRDTNVLVSVICEENFVEPEGPIPFWATFWWVGPEAKVGGATQLHFTCVQQVSSSAHSHTPLYFSSS